MAVCSYCGAEFNLSEARRTIGRYYGAGTYNDCYPNGDICTDCAVAEIGGALNTGAEVAELVGDTWYDPD